MQMSMAQKEADRQLLQKQKNELVKLRNETEEQIQLLTERIVKIEQWQEVQKNKSMGKF